MFTLQVDLELKPLTTTAVEITEENFKFQFHQFLQSYTTMMLPEEVYLDSDKECCYYIEMLKKAAEGSSVVQLDNFEINLQHIEKMNPDLLRIIMKNPADCISWMDETLSEIVSELYKDIGVLSPKVIVSLIKSPRIVSLRDLEPSDIETLVAVRGTVIRVSCVIPDMRVAVFRCTSLNAPNQPPGTICGHEESVTLIACEVQEPTQCPRCNAKYSFELETLDSIPEGETPQTIVVYVYDALVDQARPGDFLEITGTFRAAGVPINPRLKALKTVFKTYIDACSLYKENLNRLNEKNSEFEKISKSVENTAVFEDNLPPSLEKQEYTEKFVAKMQEMANDPNIYENLVKSFAPNIWECDDIKKGLLCQLFGGASKVIGGRLSRNDIHILLCGDPSTAKSQLLQYVHNISPRSVYTCGRGSSAVGLTACVTRDPESREFVLESGAVVLSDKGICCIDEFDKMDESARVVLHEVMEQQTISIAKAGIVCSLNARAGILASANPINSRYDSSKSVVENINLQPSLISRFDLVYLTLDTPNPNLDRALARHLCNLYAVESEAKVNQAPYSRKLLEQYISYARTTCKPKLSASAGAFLVETYTELRQKGVVERSLNATPRQLESLIRLSEALAKMELAEIVTEKHVTEALRLIQVATYTALIDPATGRIDFDQLNSGLSGESRVRRQLLERNIIECLKSASTIGLDRTELALMVAEKLSRENTYTLYPNCQEFTFLLRELEDFGTIGKIHGGKFVFLKCD